MTNSSVDNELQSITLSYVAIHRPRLTSMERRVDDTFFRNGHVRQKDAFNCFQRSKPRFTSILTPASTCQVSKSHKNSDGLTENTTDCGRPTCLRENTGLEMNEC